MTREFEQYEHHGAMVWVDKALRGQGWEMCLCLDCARFKIGRTDNCAIAEDTYQNTLKHHLVTPVFECPAFEEKCG